MKLIAFTLIGCLAALAIQTRGATYSYTFTAGTSTLSSSTTESLPIYLHEASSDGSSQINNDGGVFSFGFTAAIASGPATISNLTSNPAFDSVVTSGTDASTTTFPTSTASLYALQNTNFLSGVMVDSSGNALLATISFSSVTGATTFQLSDINAVGSQTVDYSGAPLDPSLITSFTIDAPEPRAWAMIMVPLIFGGLRRPRPRHIQSASDDS